MNFSKRTYYFLLNEIRLLKKAPLPIIIAIVMPFLAWICLSLTFQNGFIENMPIAVVDLDNSSDSRQLIRNIDATQAIDVDFIVPNNAIADSLFQSGKTYLTIVIEKDFSKKIKTSNSAYVKIFANAAYLMYAKVAYKIIAQTILNFSNNIQVEKMIDLGISEKEAIARAYPISTDIHALGNPYFSYTIYLIPGMLISILQMSASFSTLWVFRQHREHAAGRIIPRKGHRAAFILGKLTPILIANVISTLILFTVIFPISGIPVNSSWFDIFALTLLLVLVSMGMGIFLSILLQNLVTASQLLLVINAPSFVFSGYTFPRWAMPSGIEAFANCIPVTHFLDGFFPMFLYDYPTMRGILPLIIIGIIFWGLSIFLISKPGEPIRKFFDKILPV